MLSISTIARVIVNASGLFPAAVHAGPDVRIRGRPAPPESRSGDLSPGAEHPRS